MTFDLTWFDATLIALLAGTVVIGVRRGVAGLVSGLGGLVVWFGLNLVGGVEPLLALVLAIAVGVGLTSLARSVLAWPPVAGLSDVAGAALGGLGGAAFGAAMVAALALSFPTSPNPAAGRGQFYYPSEYLPMAVKVAVGRSVIQRWITSSGVWQHPGPIRALLLPDRNEP
jgi:hypothetical protein